jgi:hypothetical protein
MNEYSNLLRNYEVALVQVGTLQRRLRYMIPVYTALRPIGITSSVTPIIPASELESNEPGYGYISRRSDVSVKPGMTLQPSIRYLGPLRWQGFTNILT